MSRVYLVRHGQAGTRKAYDSLSDLGKRQSRILGEHFRSEKIEFAAAFSGSLDRQRETAASVKSSFAESGGRFPEITVDCRWNEFDLTHVYRALAPQLCAEDPDFRRQYEAMRLDARAAVDQHDAPVNRRWLPCDIKVVETWIAGRLPYEGESWPAFRERVAGCQSRLEQAARQGDVAVFTSATPIGIWAAMAMDIYDDRAMRLASVLRNASCTVMRLRGGQLRLDAFNTIPHLCAPELRTYR